MARSGLTVMRPSATCVPGQPHCRASASADARLRALFDGLAQGGTVRTRLERQFWGDVFGAVTDQYGIGWQVNIGTAGA